VPGGEKSFQCHRSVRTCSLIGLSPAIIWMAERECFSIFIPEI
jgi:hypothetical protein